MDLNPLIHHFPDSIHNFVNTPITYRVAGGILLHWEVKTSNDCSSCRSAETLLPLKMRELSPRDTLQERGIVREDLLWRIYSQLSLPASKRKAVLVQVSYTKVLVYTFSILSTFSVLLQTLCAVELVLL